MSSASITAAGPQALGTGWRVALAACICVVVTESLHLDFSYMSAMSAHIVMAQYPFTSFQKGVERVLGRVVGLGYATLLVLGFSQFPFLFLFLLVAGQLTAFYVYSSGRLTYTALQAGVFFHMVAYLGLTGNQEEALSSAISILIQVVLGVGVALMVNWGTGAERSTFIETRGEPLLPLKLAWMSQSCMLTTTATATMVITVALDLPVIPAVVSALLLAMASDPHALTLKAGQRILGVLVGGGYSLVALIVLHRLPHLTLLVMMVALGMLLAAYYTRASVKYSYVGLQAGLVVSMVLVGAHDELGTVTPALQRLVGIVVGSTVSLGVHFLWGTGQKANPTV